MDSSQFEETEDISVGEFLFTLKEIKKYGIDYPSGKLFGAVGDCKMGKLCVNPYHKNSVNAHNEFMIPLPNKIDVDVDVDVDDDGDIVLNEYDVVDPELLGDFMDLVYKNDIDINHEVHNIMDDCIAFIETEHEIDDLLLADDDYFNIDTSFNN